MEYKENNHSAAKAMTRARASTENILGIRSREPKINPKWARHYEHLARLREEIVAKKASLAQDANANAESPLFGEHLADAATDSYDRDWAMGMLSCEQSALYEIEAALDRLSRGTYGRCELTGGPIEPDRLRAIPWTRFCAAAQKELEEKGDLGRRQMGELRNYYDVDDSREPSDEEPEAPQTVTEQKAGRSTSPVGTPVLIER